MAVLQGTRPALLLLTLAGCSSPDPMEAPATTPPAPQAAATASASVAYSDPPLPDAARAGTSNRRAHEANQARPLTLVPATESPPAPSEAQFKVEGAYRVLRANGSPNHAVGPFPNRGNPHEIETQAYDVRVPASPALAATVTRLGNHNFGFAVNGVPFDPSAAEFYLGDRSSWQYEALGGAVALGVDDNVAHVQPTGAYHYHGLPSGLLEKLGVEAGTMSPLVGWAADGFPIYALYGPNGAEVTSSYRLREGTRPSEAGHPGGTFDGTFVADYEYSPGAGSLDMCNGTEVITEEFPEGTYAYFLSHDWPVIPRCYRGTPDASVTARGPGGPGRAQGGGHEHAPAARRRGGRR